MEAFDSISNRMDGFLYRCLNNDVFTMLIMTNQIEKITGYRPSDVIDNKVVSYASLIHKDDGSAVDRAIDEAIRKNQNWSIDYRLKTRNGDYRWVHESGGCVHDESGDVIYLEGVVVDISQRKRMEEEEKQRLQNIEASTKKVVQETKQIFSILRTLRTLSFNATIEAARAGEAGRSFSVVAEHVKKLADETGVSAQRITEILEELDAHIHKK